MLFLNKSETTGTEELSILKIIEGQKRKHPHKQQQQLSL